jgi:hypothetical protein
MRENVYLTFPSKNEITEFLNWKKGWNVWGSNQA